MEDRPTRLIAEYISGLTFEDLPQTAVANAKVAILDTIGVTLAGSGQATGAMVQRYVESAGAAERATVFASPRGTSAELAALANGVLAHVLDFDDRWHASTHTLPAALALGEVADVDGRQLLTAYVAGRELRLHLDAEFRRGRGGGADAAEGVGPGWRGWHETGVLGTLGAAAAASNVLALDVDQTQMALGISASLASGLMANFGTSTKSLHAGNAARNGVLAATLASKGFTAEPEILMARRGLVEAICYPEQRDVATVARNLRSHLHIVEYGIRIKPYPACTGTHQFIEIMRHLMRERDLRAEHVVSITISRIVGATTKRDFPTTELECKFSPAFLAIATLIDGEVNIRNCTEEFLRRHDVQDLLSRTEYEDSPTGFIRIHTTGGETFEQESLPGSREGGSPARDLESPQEIRQKFVECAEPVVGASKAANIASMVDHLDDLDSIRKLTQLLATST